MAEAKPSDYFVFTVLQYIKILNTRRLLVLKIIVFLRQITEVKIKFLNKSYKKTSCKMYDYNCDVKLIVGTETFKAHRSVLEQSSDYFSAMFAHDMLEKNNGVIELKEIRCG